MADKGKPIRWFCQFKGAVNYLPTCVTEAKYVINLANLKGHSYGITLCGKNHFGSFINGNEMRPLEGASVTKANATLPAADSRRKRRERCALAKITTSKTVSKLKADKKLKVLAISGSVR